MLLRTLFRETQIFIAPCDNELSIYFLLQLLLLLSGPTARVCVTLDNTFLQPSKSKQSQN